MKSVYFCSLTMGLGKGTGSRLPLGRIWRASLKADKGKENHIEIKIYNWTLVYSVPVDIDEPAI